MMLLVHPYPPRLLQRRAGEEAPSPAPDLIPAKTENQPRTYTAIGTVNGGTSVAIRNGEVELFRKICQCP